MHFPAVLCLLFAFLVTGVASAHDDLNKIKLSIKPNGNLQTNNVGLVDAGGRLMLEVGGLSTFGTVVHTIPWGEKWTFGNIVLTDSPYVTVESDTCSGNTFDGNIVSNNTCTYTLVMAALSEGPFQTRFQQTRTIQLHSDPEYNEVMNVDFYWKGRGIVVLPSDSANPPSPASSSCKSASIIRVDGRSLGEHVPIIGTNLVLSYSSEFAQSYTSTFAKLPAGLPFFNANGWTFNVHHFYDYNKGRIFKGSGSSELAKISVAASEARVFSADGSEMYTFDDDGRHLSTKFGLTGAIKLLFSYNSNNRLESITDSFGNVTSISYGLNTISIEAPFGQETQLSLNSNQLVSSITNPKGETHSFTYKSGTDLLASFTKPKGQTNTFTYSSSGMLVKDESSAGNFWELVEELNSTERKVTMTSAEGRSSVTKSSLVSGTQIRSTVEPFGMTREYNETSHVNSRNSDPKGGISITRVPDERLGSAFSRVSLISHNIGLIPNMTTFGRVVTPTTGSYFDFESIVDTETNAGNTHTTTYVSATNKKTLNTAAGVIQETVIDQYERPLSIKTGSDTARTFSYNSLGQLTVTSQGAKNSVTRSYNSSGYLSSETNGRGEITQYGYDLAGRVTSITRADGKVINIAYDVNGNRAGITPPGRLQHVFEFNLFDLMSKYDPPALSGVAVKETVYNYNLDKQLTSVVRPDLQTATYNYGVTTGLLDQVVLARGTNDYSYYSNRDQVQRIDSADGIRSQYSYWGHHLTGEEQRRVSDDFVYALIQYVYDGNQRRTYRGIRGGAQPSFAYINYVYNGDNMPTQVGGMSLAYTYPSGRLSSTSLEKISDQRTYDSYGNLESYTATYNPTGGTPVVLYSYTFTRDEMSRIVGKDEIVQGVLTSYLYLYDNIGRLIEVKKNGSTVSTYAYDDNGNRTSGTVAGVAFTATYDDQDRLLTYGSRVYEYNANGDNVRIKWTPTLQSTFSYDALGQLLGTTTPTGVVTGYSMDGRGNVVRIISNGTTLTRYIYDDSARIAGEFTDAGLMWRQYVYATESHSPDYLIDSTGYVKYIKDHLGSPRLLVRTSDGTILQKMDYNEFGLEIANTSPTYQPFGFAGGLYLRLPGLVKFGARYYDPMIGRWTSKDPIRFDGGDTNLYAYTSSNPINFIDPSGLDACGMSQSTGTIVCIDDSGRLSGVDTGSYSGKGAGKNNSNMSDIADTGPIPQGTYRIGGAYSHPKTGRNTRNLDPDQTTRSSFPGGRNPDTFRWHGDNGMGTASEGCPVSGPQIRLTPRTGSSFVVGQ